MRARVYIDGFNFYYRRLKHSRHKWIDLRALSALLLDVGDQIEALRYFTADVSPRAGDPNAPERQATYFRALKTIPELSIHKGKFMSKTKFRPLVSDPSTKVEIHDTEEKGSDVNFASYLLMDAFCDNYDVALVLSQDTDLLEPLRMVRNELGKEIVVAWFEQNNPGKAHRNVASSVRHISDRMLREAEFPETVLGQGGTKIVRPKEWDPNRP